MAVTTSIFGAARTVTGSCQLLETTQARLLVDCGMFQGSKTLKALNYGDFPFDPATIDAVLLTHAHIDHSGLLPKLIRAGFRGPVYATAATRDLCSAMLPDAGHIQEFEVEILNRRNARRVRPAVTPIYTAADAQASLRSFRAIDYESWFEPAEAVRARFWNAGHILGSASIELEFARQGRDGAALRLLLSGDLGPRTKALQPPAEAPSGFDYVFCESTYGDVDRPVLSAADRRRRLADEVLAAAGPHGALLMPAFAVERTQELVADLIRLMDTQQLPPAPIYIDSPLAIRTTEVFLRNAAELQDGAEFGRLMRSPILHFTETETESRAIADVAGFKIILAGSGMCDAGRIRHHLKQWLWKPAATVLLTGYQAKGTLGRLLQEGAKEVRIRGDEVSVRARIRFTDDYSGHADCAGLVGWIAARQPIICGVFLMHGEEPAIDGLQRRLAGSFARAEAVIRPQLDDVYDLTPAGAQLRRPAAPRRIAPEMVGHLDWHNERSRLVLDLSARLDAAPDDAARAEILRRLRRALDEAAA